MFFSVKRKRISKFTQEIIFKCFLEENRMNSKEIQEIFYKQMCLDFNCSMEDLMSRENVFTMRADNPGRRRFYIDDSPIKVLCLRGKIVASTTPEFADKMKENFASCNGAWFSGYGLLKKVDSILYENDYKISDFHHFYLPTGREFFTESELEEMKEGLEFRHFDERSVEQFRGDKRFERALSFLPDAPDVCAITAEKDGEILGMAGASADSPMMWQIGIDVTQESRGRNIGQLLTVMLKREILESGHLPFYGTAESHIQSQKVAVKSGFAPAWAELASAPVNDDKNLTFG